MTAALVRTFADLADAVLHAPARLGGVRLVAVDGRAGSGKSTFARRLVAALRASGAGVGEIHTDDLLDGWTDIVAFWPHLEERVLAPLSEGRRGEYHAYDWVAGQFQTEPTSVPVPDVLVVEGVSSAGAARPSRLTLSVLVVAPRDLRLARGLARDGEALRPQWLRWMADEDRYCADAAPGAPASSRPSGVRVPGDPFELVVDGAPAAPHDPEREYVLIPVPGPPDSGEAGTQSPGVRGEHAGGVDATSPVGEHPRRHRASGEGL